MHVPKAIDHKVLLVRKSDCGLMDIFFTQFWSVLKWIFDHTPCLTSPKMTQNFVIVQLF